MKKLQFIKNLSIKKTFGLLFLALSTFSFAFGQILDETDWQSSTYNITGSCLSSFPPSSSRIVDWPNYNVDDAIWNYSPGIIIKSFIIPDNKTLTINTNCAFLTDVNGSAEFIHIIVKKGGTLILDGATLTRCGSDWFWGGIQVEGDPTAPLVNATDQGRVIVTNSSSIEFAYTAIDASMGGGVIEADQSDFINCKRSIVMEHSDFNSISFFDRCQFLLDDGFPNHTLLSGALCGPSTQQLVDDAMVTIIGQDYVNFYGCDFKNNYNLSVSSNIQKTENIGGGIHLIDAQIRFLTIDKPIYVEGGPPPNPNGCPLGVIGSAKGCDFYRLAYGIRVEPDQEVQRDLEFQLLGRQKSTDQQGNDNYYHRFEDCIAGVIINGIERAIISGNVFITGDKHNNFGSADNAWCNPYSTDIANQFETVGLSIENCPWQIVSNNTFKYQYHTIENYTGVLIKNSGAVSPSDPGFLSWDIAEAQIVRNNTFLFNANEEPIPCNFSVTGLRYVGDNVSANVKCNDFHYDDYFSAGCPFYTDVKVNFQAFGDATPSFGTSAVAAGNRFTPYNNPSNYNLWVDNGFVTLSTYYMQSVCYYFEPVKRSAAAITQLSSSTSDCSFENYCLNLWYQGTE